MATDRKKYMKEYMQKRRETEEGKKEAVDISLKWQKENKEARQAYNREWMRKKRAAAKGKGEKI
jgi:hypothetical protein